MYCRGRDHRLARFASLPCRPAARVRLATLTQWRRTGDTGLRLHAGPAATLAAQLAMGASWRIGVDPGERTELVTRGAFTLVRNPIFTAMAVTTLGLTLLVPSAVSVLAWLTLVAAVQLQVRVVEEPYLLTTHPETYRAYAAATGRFLPGLGRR